MLHTAYFGSVGWYKALLQGEAIDTSETYQKQSARNHCLIVSANGVQKLTVPVDVPYNHCPIREVCVSDHGNWRHQHWEALRSAYGTSPFFEYYADDICPFFEKNGEWDKLFDFNLAITHKMCDLIGINSEVRLSDGQTIDAIEKGGRASSPSSSIYTDNIGSYYQTFQQRHGFIPGMSILDPLFNEGPASILNLIH